jgi:hypothetical protein
MKQLIISCLGLSILGASLNAQVLQTKSSGDRTAGSTGTMPSMKGAYLMTMQQSTQNQKDSVMYVNQFKIYTDGYYMYAHTPVADTLGEYGVGSYTLRQGGLTESSFYTSANGLHNDSYDVKIENRPGGYTQVINFPATASGPGFVLTESYTNMSKNLTSVLDGAWKMTRLTVIGADGTPTVINDPVQYKFYQSGYFIFGTTQTDAATHRTTSGIGYGSFTVNSPNEITETAINSSYRSNMNTPVRLKLGFTGKDRYQQTIVWPDGSKMIEEYERLK